ncbi:hypothetical protein KTG68_05615 [Acinetobacter variabilis]|jgi:hypothetical protein|uniref:Uncharacterized protein n=1 Tax=Acinetobacter variabilis TaxID=70346 RepID=N8WR16_9GAMM|nr:MULTISPECIES: hypothetical protein [Acinetobacter]EXA65336.1 hypothetical protein J504_2100 [Acinetobacter baumannii 348935]HCL60338.1 hypothetical protein [Acinetobacter sp.]AUX88476.1 hypothetical protein C3F22_00590 [Acinetobacter sp. ACNIH1]ENU97399.1 hypothetical protein F969_03622 [Acinetobacter variabilis]MCU4311541.1 hypothetical protein [Acinetobacter variabilis]
MLRLLAVTILGLGVMTSGCTTTQKVIAKVQSSSDTPLDQVLKMRPDLREELATVEIRQFFNRVESPTVGQVKVTETGLMDDSVRSIQTIYHFRKEEKNWKMHNTEKLYQCVRGSNTKTFQKAVCP